MKSSWDRNDLQVQAFLYDLICKVKRRDETKERTMRPVRFQVHVGFAFAFLLLVPLSFGQKGSSAPSHPTQAQNQYHYCSGYYRAGQPSKTYFLSGVFESAEGNATIDRAWKDFLKAKYGVADTNCSAGDRTSLERLVASEATAKKGRGYLVVSTGWKYTPGQAQPQKK